MVAFHMFSQYCNGAINNFIEYLDHRIPLFSLTKPFINREVTANRKRQCCCDSVEQGHSYWISYVGIWQIIQNIPSLRLLMIIIWITLWITWTFKKTNLYQILQQGILLKNRCQLFPHCFMWTVMFSIYILFLILIKFSVS